MDKLHYNMTVSLAILSIGFKCQAATFHPATSVELVDAVNTANTNDQDDTILLGDRTFVLTAPDNNIEGANGLPVILDDNGHSLTIRGGLIERDPSASFFRLMDIAQGGKLDLERVTLRNGLSADASGGGALLNHGELGLLDCQFWDCGCVLGDGGAIANSGGTISRVDRCLFDGCFCSEGDGGAICNGSPDSDLILGRIDSIRNTSFANNFALSGHGGALANFQTMNTLDSNTWYDNTAVLGGALFTEGAKATTQVIEDSTFAGNHATGPIVADLPGRTLALGKGGAIYMADGAKTAKMDNNTIAYNTAGDEGGGVWVENLSEFDEIVSNLIADNLAPNGPDFWQSLVLAAPSVSGRSYNLIGSPNGNSFVNGVDNNLVGTPTIPLDPLFEPLENNGGLPWTIGLSPDSPAVDHGSNPESLLWDERGPPFVRTFGQTDIGAFELQPTPDNCDSPRRRRPRRGGGGAGGFFAAPPIPLPVAPAPAVPVLPPVVVDEVPNTAIPVEAENISVAPSIESLENKSSGCSAIDRPDALPWLLLLFLRRRFKKANA